MQQVSDFEVVIDALMTPGRRQRSSLPDLQEEDVDTLGGHYSRLGRVPQQGDEIVTDGTPDCRRRGRQSDQQGADHQAEGARRLELEPPIHPAPGLGEPARHASASSEPAGRDATCRRRPGSAGSRLRPVLPICRWGGRAGRGAHLRRLQRRECLYGLTICAERAVFAPSRWGEAHRCHRNCHPHA